MNRSIRYAAITLGLRRHDALRGSAPFGWRRHYRRTAACVNYDTSERKRSVSTVAGGMIVNTFTDVEHETMTPGKTLISVPNLPIAHAALDADIANYPSERFALRNGRLVFPPS